MSTDKYSIISHVPADLIDVAHNVNESVREFASLCDPLEDRLYVLIDARTNARYCECHIATSVLLERATIDVPLDPDDQPDYRANREIMEDHVAFAQMKADARERRTFSNIVAEFDTSHDPDSPLKIIGGQHRFLSIQQAHQEGIAEYHGLKVYFGLDTDQRLDVQLISNRNIAVSTDLYDRLQETASGPELRTWCQEVGFLDAGQGFSARRLRGSAMTVRDARSFILNYYLGMGRSIDALGFDSAATTPIICKTGQPDSGWDTLRSTKSGIWEDPDLKDAAREFVLLDEAQRDAIERISGKVPSHYAEKALNFSIMTAWAYVAGVLQGNTERLRRHYNLRHRTGKDPLNAVAMASGRHKSDPENYRGLGTRNSSKERGRCAELFYLQAEKGKGITPSSIDLALKRYHVKQDSIELRKAESNY